MSTWPTMGAADFSLSRDGSLLFGPGRAMGIDYRVVTVDRAGALNVFLTAGDGSGEVRRLAGGPRERSPRSWTPDGQTLVFSQHSEDSGVDIWLLEADGETEPFLEASSSSTSLASCSSRNRIKRTLGRTM